MKRADTSTAAPQGKKKVKRADLAAAEPQGKKKVKKNPEERADKKKVKKSHEASVPSRGPVPVRPLPPHQLVLAPMVGGSELPFRLLARKYGAQLCYTPMIYSGRFVTDGAYRAAEMRSAKGDAPLVAHFCGNSPVTILAAARLAEPYVVAVDLNLGCPQRCAHSGNFGSYLCATAEGRATVLEIVRTLSSQLGVPVFCKIRLLDEIEDTLAFVRRLREAGCALLAVHARYRGSATRRRDGAAHLDCVREIKGAAGSMPVLTNGNVKTAADLVASLRQTGADGVMSAEGALDDPALFGRAAAEIGAERAKLRKEIALLAKGTDEPQAKKKLRLLQRQLAELPVLDLSSSAGCGAELPSRVALALEYLSLAKKHGVLSAGGPSDIPCARFHVRRMCRDELDATKLRPQLEATTTLGQMGAVARHCHAHAEGTAVSEMDAEAVEALGGRAECEKRNRAKRAEFEGRMSRKARREGKPDDFYTRGGSVPPTDVQVAELRAMSEGARMGWWAARFGQHCLAHHAVGSCERAQGEHGCAFLHVAPTSASATEALDVAPSWLCEANETPAQAAAAAARVEAAPSEEVAPAVASREADWGGRGGGGGRGGSGGQGEGKGKGGGGRGKGGGGKGKGGKGKGGKGKGGGGGW